MQQLSSRPDRPDLVICDYRLREGENGITVIQRMRSEYNKDIPAMLITEIQRRIAWPRLGRAG
jgi:CheY-like chemotaxis protein